MVTELLALVKENLILTHNEDDVLLKHFITAATSYATGFQHLPALFYEENPMSDTTRQAVILLATHFYESRDGSTAGFWNDKANTTSGVWEMVNRLLVLDREWKI